MNSSKKFLIGMIVCVALMLALSVPLLILTEGRSFSEYSDRDHAVFGIFIISEFLAFVAFYICTVRFADQNSKGAKEEKSLREKQRMRQGAVLMTISLIISVAMTCLGGNLLPHADKSCYILLAACAAIAIILPILNRILSVRYAKFFNGQSYEQRHDFFISHRDRAEETAREKLAFLKKIKVLTDIYAAFLFIVGSAAAYLGGAVGVAGAVTVSTLSSLIILAALSRIRYKATDTSPRLGEITLYEHGYPEIYAIARRAADKLGCKGMIFISITGGANVGIYTKNGSYRIVLGIMAWRMLSEEELYSILLHEFAHVSDANSERTKIGEYYRWLSDGQKHLFYFIPALFFSFSDTVSMNNYTLFNYADAITHEAYCDRAMTVHGDAQAAASHLIKIKYFTLYQWESWGKDRKPLYSHESPHIDHLLWDVERFLEVLDSRREIWKSYLEKEILSRQSTHPTVKMRLDALGLSDYNTLAAVNTDSPCFAECMEAAQALVDYCSQYDEVFYKQNRKLEYLDSLETVAAWEKAGRPIIAEEYRNIFGALYGLGRVSEAHEFILRAMNELPDAAAIFAHFIHGCYLLHEYNAEGLNYVYRAIDNNSNLIGMGMDVIGEFCCITGNSEELEKYREKALRVGQDEIDKYSKLSTLTKKDKISEEHLPEDILAGILGYIDSLGEQSIKRIYIVRKTITDDFFTSAVIVCFNPETNIEKRNDIFDKLYRYLDTATEWQFSLFDYREVAKLGIEKIPNSLIYQSKC